MAARMDFPDVQVLRCALDGYSEVVEGQRVERLPELDRWYHDELPSELRSRDPMYATRAELIRVTEWKMARGVWRARNLVLVRSNDAAEVEAAGKDALSKIPHPTAPISTLAKLKGVGPATASAVVAAAAPEAYPFFDELVAAQIPGLGKVAWTLSYYARYAEALRRKSDELGVEWTPARLADALWAHAGGKAGHSPA